MSRATSCAAALGRARAASGCLLAANGLRDNAANGLRGIAANGVGGSAGITPRRLTLPVRRVLTLPVRRVLAVTALLVPGTLPAQDPSAAPADPPGSYDQGLFEIAAERLPPLTVLVLVDSAGSVLLPLESVLRFLGYPVRVADGRWEVPRRGGARATLDVTTRTLRLARDSVALAPAEVVQVGAEVYLRGERIAELLEGAALVDFARLVVTFTREAPFPAQHRLELELRRSVLQPRGARDAAARANLRESTASGVGVVDWEVATNGLDPTSLTTGRLQLGSALLGGGLTGSARFEAGRDGGERVRDGALRYHRAFARSRWIAQAEVGDIITHGMFARYVRGAELTNAPYARNYDLGEIALQPELPPGWQYEVVQGSQLLGYSEDARAPVSVPLRLGATPVEVRMYGPAGEEVVQRLVYQTPVTLLEKRRLEYTVGGGVCPRDDCDGYLHGDVRWGILSTLTLGTGAEAFEDSAGRDLRPYALASFTTGTRLVGELQLMPRALYRANLVGWLGERTTARVHADVATPGYGRLAAVAEAGHRYDVDAWLERRVGARDGRVHQLRLNAGALGRTAGPLERWRTGAQLVNARGMSELRYDRAVATRDLVSAHAARFLGVGARLRPTVLAGIGASRLGIEILEAGGTVQPRPLANLAGTVRWSRDAGASVSLGWHSRIGPAQSSARLAAARDADPTSTLALSGSAAFAPGGGVQGEALGRVGYGGVRGTAFLDRDGDGVLGPGDTPLPDVPLLVAGAPTTTDARGRYVVWRLLPYVETAVTVDSLRIADPSVMPARARTATRIIPNTAVRLDLPLVQTRELAGSLVAGPGVPTLAGLKLLLAAAGDVPVETTTFSDGTFYVSRLRPGRYTLTVAPSSLEAIDATVPVPLTFELATGTEMLELEALRVERRGR